MGRMIHATLLLLLAAAPPDSNGHEAVLHATVEQAESARPTDASRVDAAIVALAQFLQDGGRYREAEPLYVR